MLLVYKCQWIPAEFITYLHQKIEQLARTKHRTKQYLRKSNLKWYLNVSFEIERIRKFGKQINTLLFSSSLCHQAFPVVFVCCYSGWLFSMLFHMGICSPHGSYTAGQSSPAETESKVWETYNIIRNIHSIAIRRCNWNA